MRCLFCKNPSDSSKSVEHILPESLGNTTLVLPNGIVCDGCNNYFSRKIEAPFLNAPAVRALRAWQSIPTKRGRLVGMPGVLMKDFPVTAYLRRHGMSSIDTGTSDVFDKVVKRAKRGDPVSLLLATNTEPPNDHAISRFLAKVALEAMALRCVGNNVALESLVDDPQLAPVRDHARRGDPRVRWPYSARRIYDMDKGWTDLDGINQRIHEHYLLLTEHSELYFVVAIFGLELVLNVGGPEIDGYQQWLREHNQASPLYFGANAHPDY